MTYGQAYLSGWKRPLILADAPAGSSSGRFSYQCADRRRASGARSLATLVDPHYGILSFVVIPFAALWLLLMALPCWL